MPIRRSLLIAAAAVVAIAIAGVLPVPRPARPQQPADVLLNVIASGAKRLNIAIPDFTLGAGADPQGLAKQLPLVLGNDLNFSALFTALAGTPALPDNPAALREAWANFAATGAHAALLGLLSTRGDRAEVEMRLFDLTSPEQRLIASKKFEM